MRGGNCAAGKLRGRVCARACIHLSPWASKQSGIAACADGHPPSGIGRGLAAIAVQPFVPARSTVVPSITVAPAESGDGHAEEYAAIFHRSEVCEKYSGIMTGGAAISGW